MSNGIEISPIGNLLLYKRGYSPEFVKSVLDKFRLKGLKVNSRSEKLVSLEFLTDFVYLRSLEIVGQGDFSFGFLNSLRRLERLSIGADGKTPIEFSNLIRLEDLTLLWRKDRIHGLEKCQRLTSLCLVEYEEDDFRPVEKFTGLIQMQVKTGSIQSVKGIESLTNLRSLLLGNCKRLSSLDDLASSKNLSSLRVELCPRLQNYNPVGFLSKLEELEIIDCNGIQTIKFVEKLRALHRLSLLGSTDVLDGDLLPAKHVKEVFYKNRNHYNVRIENTAYDKLVEANRKKVKKAIE
jgi:hypothetical protein